MKLAFIRLAKFFGAEVITLQQIADNMSLSTEEVLNIDSIESSTDSLDYQEGLMVNNVIEAKIYGAGKIQYWKGVLSNV